MPIHMVQQGEYLQLIAERYGFRSWRTIYNHASNAELRRKRPNPNVIHPGDEIFVPEKSRRHEPCSTGKRHWFRVVTPEQPMLRIIVKDTDGDPIANEPYVLTLGDTRHSGQTDGNGLLERPVPLGAETGELTLDSGVRWVLKVGYLDPLDDRNERSIVTGAQARLNNLAFGCGSIDGIAGRKTLAAIRLFQEVAMKRDEASGELDRETRAALQKEYGC